MNSNPAQTAGAVASLERDGAIAIVTLNREQRRNALNPALVAQLLDSVAAVERESEARVLILRGAGPAFCSGLDLADPAEPEPMARLIQTLCESRLVTIAAVHGAAIAGGAGIMSACDFAVAAEDTKVGYPETKRGLVAALVMTLLRRQIRERDARQLLLTGELISAERARDMGLVNAVVRRHEVVPEAKAIAGSVMAGGPEAVVETKRLLATLWPRPLADDLRLALRVHALSRGSAEAAEGLAAFRERRLPRWP
jgi:methylglutaconyl-CoA hydratase